MKKKPGYYWRLKKSINERFHDGATLYLSDFPKRAQVYIVHMSFSHLHKIEIKIKRGK